MKTKEYVKKYRLDEPQSFNRKQFLSDLNEDFLELLENNQATQDYDKFRNCVTQIEQKFWAINNKKIGYPFTTNFWGAFYAIYIIKKREELFPEIDARIKGSKKITEMQA